MPSPAPRLHPAVAAGLSAVAAALCLLAPAPAAAADPGAAPVDPYAAYSVESGCSSSVQPGVAAVRDRILKPVFGGADSDYLTLRACGPAHSGHEEGRALDWMMDARDPTEGSYANSLLTWLLASDGSGQQHDMARRLGVMYIEYNNLMWRAYAPEKGWQPQYVNGVPCAKLGPSYDTKCHRDHVHLSFSQEGAAMRTSYWRWAAGRD